jgi:hypothetical protein
MPKSPSSLPSGVRITDTLTVTQFATVFPLDVVTETLDKHGCGTIRVRHLPNEMVIFFVMMLALFRDCSHREVFRCVALALSQLLGRQNNDVVIPTASALSQARDRVKPEVFEELFQRFAVPLAAPGTSGCFFKNKWRKVALDGSLVDTDDTDSNRNYFGSSTNQYGKRCRSPQTRFVGLMEIGTHAFFKAAIGTYYDGETSLTRALLPYVTADMICLADRNFYGFDLFKAMHERRAALLFRVQRGLSFQPNKQLSDGSYLVTLYSSADTKKQCGLQARFFQYKVKAGRSEETFSMLTNILDPDHASAEELAMLYCERWEYENALDEVKTHLNAKAIILRSKTPDLVVQELWGILMTHYVVRRLSYLAASQRQLDPDRISFVHTVRVIKRALVKTSFSPLEGTVQGANS